MLYVLTFGVERLGGGTDRWVSATYCLSVDYKTVCPIWHILFYNALSFIGLQRPTWSPVRAISIIFGSVNHCGGCCLSLTNRFISCNQPPRPLPHNQLVIRYIQNSMPFKLYAVLQSYSNQWFTKGGCQPTRCCLQVIKASGSAAGKIRIMKSRERGWHFRQSFYSPSIVLPQSFRTSIRLILSAVSD